MTNIANVTKVADWFEAHPERLEQDYWVTGPGGSVEAIRPKLFRTLREEPENISTQLCIGGAVVLLCTEFEDTHAEDFHGFYATTMQVLDISPEITSVLVYGTENSDAVPRLRYLAAHPEVTASDLESIHSEV